MITLHLTNSEATMIRYALKEMANRRQEQAIDYKASGLDHHCAAAQKDAIDHRVLAERIQSPISPKST